MNNYPHWSIAKTMYYTYVGIDKDGDYTVIIKNNEQVLSKVMKAQIAQKIIDGEFTGFGYWITSEDLLGKQVKIENKTGIVIGSYPAGLYSEKEIFVISIFGNLNGPQYFNRSEFEIF